MNIVTETDEAVYESAEMGNEPKVGVGKHLLLACFWFATNFLWGAFLGPVLSSQMAKLAPEDSAKYLGYLYTIGAFPALLIPLLFGPLSDRSNHKWGRRRPFIFWGSILAMGGLSSMAAAYNVLNVGLYFLGYLVLQIGANIAIAAYSGVIPDLVPSNQRGTASGYMALMSQVATLAGALISGILIQKKMDLPMFGLILVVFGVFLILTMFGVKEERQTLEHPKFEWIPYFKSLWIDPRQYPDFAWVWLTRALMMLGFYSIQPYLLYFLRDVVHVKHPASTAGIVFGIILLAATISGFLGGMISDKTGRKPVVIYSSLVIAVMCVFLVFAKNLEQALVMGTLFGLGYGAYISVDWALGTDVLPNKEHAGKDMAVWHVSMTLPQQIAPIIIGELVLSNFKGPSIIEDGKKVVTYAHPGYIVMFFFAAICFALSGILVRKVKGAR